MQLGHYSKLDLFEEEAVFSPQLIPKLKNEKIVQVASGFWHNLVLTDIFKNKVHYFLLEMDIMANLVWVIYIIIVNLNGLKH